MAYYSLDSSYIDISNCHCNYDSTKNCRYALEIPFKREADDIIFVVMLNPSSSAKAHVFYNIPFAKIKDIDSTTNNVLSILNKNLILNGNCIVVKKVILLNLFPYFSPSPRDINVINGSSSLEEQKNFQVIEQYIRKYANANILVGWGKSGIGKIDKAIHKKAIKTVKELFKKYNNKCFYYNNGVFVSFNPSGRLMYVAHAKNWR